MKASVCFAALMLIGIMLLNARGPILGSRKQLGEFTVGPVHIRFGYIK